MKRSILVGLVACLLSVSLGATEPEPSTEERRIGKMVIAVQAALETPGEVESLETIVRFGTDTRHYVMIRSWLVQLRAGVSSQLDAAKDPDLVQRHQAMKEFLDKAIRRIDLE